MSKMFPDTETDNPYTGCDQGCPWCWAKPLALKFQMRGIKKYENGFMPTMHWANLNKPPKKAKNLFVVDMGDLFCGGSKSEWIKAVMEWCFKSNNPQNFLFLTKNPARYLEILNNTPSFSMQKRFVFGATIETNRDGVHLKYLAPNAPLPSARITAMVALRLMFPNLRIFLCLEPIMDFNVEEMCHVIEQIKPEFCYIGFDNYNQIPKDHEPDMAKIRVLMKLTKDTTNWTTKTLREG